MGIYAIGSEVVVAYTRKFLHASSRDCHRTLGVYHELNELNKSLKFMSFNDVQSAIGFNRFCSLFKMLI